MEKNEIYARSDSVRANNGGKISTMEDTKKNKDFLSKKDQTTLMHRNFVRNKITKIIKPEKEENINEYMLKLKRVIKNLTVFEEGIIQMGCMKPVNFEPIYILAQMQARLYKIKEKIDLIPNEFKEIIEKNIRSIYLNIIDQCLGGPSENESLSEIVNSVGNIDKIFSKYEVNHCNNQPCQSEETILTRLTEGLLDLKKSEDQQKFNKQCTQNIYKNIIPKNLYTKMNIKEEKQDFLVKPVEEIFTPVCVTQVDKMLRKTFPCAEYTLASNIFGFHYLLPIKLSKWTRWNAKTIEAPDHISTHKTKLSDKAFEKYKNSIEMNKNILTTNDVKLNLKSDTYCLSNQKEISNKSIESVRDGERSKSPYESDRNDQGTLSPKTSTDKNFGQMIEKGDHLYILKVKPSYEEVRSENKRNLKSSSVLMGYRTDSTTSTHREKRNAVYTKLENFFLQTLNQPIKSSSAGKEKL